MILTGIGGGFQLDAPASASFRRMLAAGMPFSHVTETYRPYSEQVSIFLSRYRVQWVGSGPYGDARWWKGKRYVRFSSAGMAAIPGTSVHGNGNAMDCNDPMRSWIRAHPQYGWRFTIFDSVGEEPWHTEYNILRDANQFAPTPPASSVLEGIPVFEFKITTTKNVYLVAGSGVTLLTQVEYNLLRRLKRTMDNPPLDEEGYADPGQDKDPLLDGEMNIIAAVFKRITPTTVTNVASATVDPAALKAAVDAAMPTPEQIAALVPDATPVDEESLVSKVIAAFRALTWSVK